jgi:hypothetical protein
LVFTLGYTVNKVKHFLPFSNNMPKKIFAFKSHQIADVTWHSLGVDEGFLSAMGFVKFHINVGIINVRNNA